MEKWYQGRCGPRPPHPYATGNDGFLKSGEETIHKSIRGWIVTLIETAQWRPFKWRPLQVAPRARAIPTIPQVPGMPLRYTGCEFCLNHFYDSKGVDEVDYWKYLVRWRQNVSSNCWTNPRIARCNFQQPERINPSKDTTGYDIKSDVWSLGITVVRKYILRFPLLLDQNAKVKRK